MRNPGAVASNLSRPDEPHDMPRGDLGDRFKTYTHLRRKLGELVLLIGKVRHSEVYESARNLRLEFEGNGFMLSAVICGIIEIKVQEWLDSEELMPTINHLEKIFRSANPGHNLSQLLWRVRKKLAIPAYSLRVHRYRDRTVLVNRGIIFTTDYQEFEQIIIHAKASERAGEWETAREEYMRAFRLIQGKPFQNMYDSRSEDRRTYLIFLIEEVVYKFTESCKQYGNIRDAVQILGHFRKIMPESEKIRALLDKVKV